MSGTEHIFKLFTDSIAHKSDDEIEKEIMESAHWNIKMFIKYVTNLKNFQLKLLMLAQKGTGKNLQEQKEDAEFIGFHKAFSYLSKVNLYVKEHIMDLDLINPYDLAYAIQVTKNYFLNKEDYDKVAFLSEIQTYIENNYVDVSIEE